MSRITKNMPSLQGVAAGQTAICNLPVGLSYYVLVLEHKRSGVAATEAQMRAELGDIRLIIDGENKITASASELLDLYQRQALKYGWKTLPGVLPIVLSKPTSRTNAGEDSLTYGTSDVQTMTVEVDIDPSATAPALSITALQGAPSPLGKHITIKRFGRSAAGAGEFEVSDLPRGNYGLMALHILSDKVNSVEVEAAGAIVFKSDGSTAAVLDSLMGKDSDPASAFHVDFTNTDRMDDNLPLNIQDFRIRMDMSAADSFNILMERIDTHVPAQK